MRIHTATVLIGTTIISILIFSCWFVPIVELSPSKMGNALHLTGIVRPSWHGFGSIGELIVFGDEHARQIESQSSYGRHERPVKSWIEHLPRMTNRTDVLVTNYAQQIQGRIRSVHQQIKEDFAQQEPYQAPDATLFILLAGYQDIFEVYQGSTESLHDRVKQLERLLEFLYRFGARNYLIANMPRPERRCKHLQHLVRGWNEKVASAGTDFAARHTMATVLALDVYSYSYDISQQEPPVDARYRAILRQYMLSSAYPNDHHCLGMNTAEHKSLAGQVAKDITAIPAYADIAVEGQHHKTSV